jgi:predicted amidohydrolase
VRVASVQFEAGDRSKAENWARAEALVDGITGADLVLLPEIWNVGYFSFDRYAAEAEPLDGETVGRLRARSRGANAATSSAAASSRRATAAFTTRASSSILPASCWRSTGRCTCSASRPRRRSC